MGNRCPRLLAVAATVLAGATAGLPAGGQENATVAPAGATERVSVAADGAPADGQVTGGSISADGRYVAFSSDATNLVPGAGDHERVFVRDRAAGVTELIGSGFNPTISADGRVVSFASNASGTFQVYAHDRLASTTELVSRGPDGPADSGATNDGVSADGRFVAFTSSASNLVPGAADNLVGVVSHVYVKDRLTGEVELVSVASDGTPGDLFSLRGAISADGRYVAFQSLATNLDDGAAADSNVLSYDVYVRDRDAGVTVKASVGTDGTRGTTNSYCPAISGNGRFVAFPSYAAQLVPADANRAWDVVVRDLDSGRTERVEVTSAGAESSGSGWPWNCGVGLSRDGRFVVFTTLARNLVDGDTQDPFAWEVFLHDRHSGQTEKVAVAGDGTQGDTSAIATAISADGRHVAFRSGAALAPSPSDPDAFQLFVRDRGPGLGIGALDVVTIGEEEVAVTGWAGIAGTVVAAASAAEDEVAVLGTDLIGASVAHRPFHRDLLVRWAVSELPGLRGQGVQMGPSSIPLTPGAAGAPGVVYGLDLTVDGQPFQVRAMRGHPLAEFGLYRCTLACELAAVLEGGIGTAGEDVRTAVPLEALGASAGAAFTALRAWTGLGTPSSEVADAEEVLLADWVLDDHRIEFGSAAPGTPPEQVSFDRSVPVGPDGRFAATLTIAADDELWSRACCGDECTPAVRSE